MDLLSSISKRIELTSKWTDVATQIGIDVNDIDNIKRKNNCATEFVYTLTNKLWNVIFGYVNIMSSNDGYINITNIDKLTKILAGHINVNEEERGGINLLKEIGSRLGKWKKFARILGLEESAILAIEKCFPSPGLYIQRTLEVMKKFSHPLPPTTSWEFWRQYLKQFEDGKVVIEEMEMNFPSLLAEVSNTGEHMISVEKFSYVGHPFDYKNWKSFNAGSDAEVIPVRLWSDSFVDFQSISQWMDTRQQYGDRYKVLKEINAFNFTNIGDNICLILTTLKNHLEKTNDSGFVVKGYHFIDHICLFKPGLFAKSIFDDHYFCFIANDGVVLYITVCSQGKNDALYHSIRNIQIANLLHKELNTSEILQINVIVHNDDEDKFCITCIDNSLFVEKDVFEDSEIFENWYKNNLSKKWLKIPSMPDHSLENIKDISHSVKKDMFAYEALENTSLPSFSHCKEDQVEELEKIVALTPPQMNALYSNEKHIFIRGSYGSGKSLILDKRFEKVISTFDERDVSHLIVNDQQSEFYHHMKKLQCKYPDKNIIVCQSKDILPSIAIPKLSTVLSVIRDTWPNNTNHVFIDEFSGYYIDKNEVLELKTVLSFYSNSHIVVALQSMEEHVVYRNYGKYIDVGYHIDLLAQKTSFVICHFEHSLRSSYEINEFVKATANIFEASKTEVDDVENFLSSGKYIDKEYGMENFKLRKTIEPSVNMDFWMSYRFNQSDTTGHTVKSGPVEVYFIDKKEISKISDRCTFYMCILSYILNDSSSNDKYVVCTYDKDLYNTCADFLEKNSFDWTNNVSNFINVRSSYEVLLVDYASVRGFEFPNFVFMVPLGSKFLKYRILECLTRATTKLFLITDNMKFTWKLFSRNSEYEIDRKLLHQWKQLDVSIFYDVKYDKSSNVIKTFRDGKIIVVKEAVKETFYDFSSDKFPWGQGVSLKKGEHQNDAVLAVIKNLLPFDKVDLCKSFIESSNITFDIFDQTLLANVLKLCIETNAVEIFKLLVYEQNFETDFKHESYPSLLKTAIESKNVNIVQMLIDSKHLPSSTTYSAYDIAHMLTDVTHDANSEAYLGSSLLYEASCKGYMDLVRHLISRDVDISFEGGDKDVPLLAAISNDQIEVAELLLQTYCGKFRDMEMLKKLYEGSIPLLAIAILYGHIDIVDMLIDKGFDVNLQDLHGNSPLFHAIKYNDVHIIELLLEKNVDINIQNNKGNTAIHYAIDYFGNVKIIQLLLDNNVDINIKNNQGNTPLHLAIKYYGRMDIVNLILERDADVNIQNSDGSTPLHEAFKYCCIDLAKRLINKNGDLDLTNRFGLLPLGYASEKTQKDITLFLNEK